MTHISLILLILSSLMTGSVFASGLEMQEVSNAPNEGIDQVKNFDLNDLTDIVLLTGQSNALGAHTRFDPQLDAPHIRAMAFSQNGWVQANLNQIWDLNWWPRGKDPSAPSNNLGFHFIKNVANSAEQRVVGLILVTAPGKAIKHWDKDGLFYQEIKTRVDEALAALPHKNSIDGILWHQGEANWGDSQSYSDALSELINRFRAEPWFSPTKPFICAETTSSPVNRRLMALNNDGDHWTGCVVASDLPSRDKKKIHFSAVGLRELGKRYAGKYLQMLQLSIEK